MSSTNQKSHKFQITLTLKIEGYNIGSFALRLIGILASLTAAGVKVWLWYMQQLP